MRAQDNVEEGYTADTSMISQNSPYQPTTQPIPDRKQIACFTLDLAYMKSRIGILNQVIFSMSFLIIICVAIAQQYGHELTSFCAVWALVYTLIIVIIFSLRLFEKITFINWPLSVFLNSAPLALLLFIGSCISASNAHGNGAGIAITVFGMLTTGLLALKAYLEFLIWRKGANATPKPTVAHVKGAEL